MLLNQIKKLWQKLISKFILLKAIVTPIDKTKRDKQVNVLASEINELEKHISAIQELINQSNSNFEVYKNYYNFFYDIYNSYHNEIIYGIGRLIDQSNDSLSITNLLKEGIEKKDSLADDEAKIHTVIKEHPMHKKIKQNRNKLGKAHLDKAIATNPQKQMKIYDQYKYELKETIEYVELLKESVEIISWRSSNPICCLLTYNGPIKKEIRNIFEKLAKQSSI